MLHVYIYRFTKRILRTIYLGYTRTVVWLKFKFNNVKVGKGLKSFGIPLVDVWIGSSFSIGDNFMMNNGKYFNAIGRQQSCCFVVQQNGVLKIGNNVGVSDTAIVCHKSITIADNVTIGGNVVIYDTDFHSLNKEHRKDLSVDIQYTRCVPVIIEKDAFIGAHSTILKGVTIGEGAIVGACSVITKSIPKYEIWAGNPARFIKNIEEVN
jgi:acetyltransferase-like isoleucine patch superfamily enzyme